MKIYDINTGALTKEIQRKIIVKLIRSMYTEGWTRTAIARDLGMELEEIEEIIEKEYPLK